MTTVWQKQIEILRRSIYAEIFKSKMMPFSNKSITFDTEMIKFLISKLPRKIIYIKGSLEYIYIIMYL